MPTVTDDNAYDQALTGARDGCCNTWPKPCTYHDGYGDGYEHAERDHANRADTGLHDNAINEWADSLFGEAKPQ